MTKLILLLLAGLTLSSPSWAQTCPGGNAEEEAPLKVRAGGGRSLLVCGFEDREIERPKGWQAYADFVVYSAKDSVLEPEKVFVSDAGDTHWVRAVKGKGFELDEVWIFAEKPYAAIRRVITCKDSGCSVSDTKCTFKMKRNPFPKALAELKSHKGKLGDKGEELLAEIWAQALTGDKDALEFYDGKAEELPATFREEFEANKAKLALAKQLKCPSLPKK